MNNLTTHWSTDQPRCQYVLRLSGPTDSVTRDGSVVTITMSTVALLTSTACPHHWMCVEWGTKGETTWKSPNNCPA